jgi:hypothetical protein
MEAVGLNWQLKKGIGGKITLVKKRIQTRLAEVGAEWCEG